MRAFEILLERRWILKSLDRELYYELRDETPKIEKFIKEKLGYQLIVNPYLIKLEKLPARAAGWMGIQDFNSVIEYIFLCMALMFLEGKEAGEQFVLSELTEFIQSQYQEEDIDWTIYDYRRRLIKVLKFCRNCGIMEIDDGNEEGFALSGGEVLYENIGVSRYFMKNFTRDIGNFASLEDFAREEWADLDEDRGVVRRHRVYRQLLMTMGLSRTGDNEEDFAYLRNYRGMIEGDLTALFDCELHVHKNAAFLVLGDECRMGKVFPEGNTASDVTLLLNNTIAEEVKEGRIQPGLNEEIRVSKEYFDGLIEKCRRMYLNGLGKTWREMTTRQFTEEIYAYIKELGIVREENGDIFISQIAGKLMGHFPDDFKPEETAGTA